MQPETMKDEVVAALEDMKGQDIRVLDVRGMTDVTDFMVVASGTSDRHVKSIADHARERLREQGIRPLGTEGEQGGDWVLMDFGDVVLHVMLPKTRAFYELEKLWDKELIGKVEQQREHGGD
jgi:ribosome-associated protein